MSVLKRVEIREVFKNMELRSVIASLLVFLLTVSATFALGFMLYRSTKNSIILQGEVNTEQSVKEFDRYLIVWESSVSHAGQVVSEMLASGRASGDIAEYLTAESQSIRKTVDPNSTGLFGLIGGIYCGGGGKPLEDGASPTDRPWYREALVGSGAVVFTGPYLDEQTQTVMTTAAVCLEDGVSVLALDVSLARIQKITEDIARHSPNSLGVVLDRTGQVVSHSDSEEVGKCYPSETGTLGRALADRLFSGSENQFELSFGGHTYMVYADDIAGGWLSASLIDTRHFYRPLTVISLLLLLLTLTEAAVFLAVFYRMTKKSLAVSIRNVQIGAIADMYMSVYDIDITQDSIREIRRGRHSEVSHVIGSGRLRAEKTLNEMLKDDVDEASRPVMAPFIDMMTLPRRLEHTDTISEEFLNSRNHWCRGRFTVAERDKDGRAVRVLWMIESVDEERKHREHLKTLSETDRMTGLYNRTAGESRISELIEHGVGGMLIMLDVDNFKSINDGFGHHVGDEVIIAAAAALSSVFRSSDVVMRLGGDEFVAYAPGVLTERAAGHIIDRLFSAMLEKRVEELGDHPVCTSVGAAFCPAGVIMPFSELYKRADRCAYQSKNREGNAVTYYKE